MLFGSISGLTGLATRFTSRPTLLLRSPPTFLYIATNTMPSPQSRRSMTSASHTTRAASGLVRYVLPNAPTFSLPLAKTNYRAWISKSTSLTPPSGIRLLHYQRQHFLSSTIFQLPKTQLPTASFHTSRQTHSPFTIIPDTFLALKTLQGAALLAPVFLGSYTFAYLTFGRIWFSNAANPSSKIVRAGRWVFRWSPVGLVLVMCLIGLEPAPNTGRWRVFFWTKDTAPVGAVGAMGDKDASTALTPATAFDSISLTPPLSLPLSGQILVPEPVFLTGSHNNPQSHLDEEGHTYIAGQLLKELKDNDLIVEDPENKALQLVRHVFKNLLEGAVQDDGNHLKPYFKEKIASLAPITILSTTTSPTTTSTTAKSTTAFEAKYKDVSRFGKRPFRVHVSKDKGQQAFADGFRNIVIEQNLIEEVGYDEDMVAAVLAHELAHAMQDHVHEQASFQTAVFNTGCVLLGHFWPKIFTLGPFASLLIPYYFLQHLYPPLTLFSSRTCEKEADLLSLEILARSGYDPISAARVQKFFVESEEKLLLAKFVRCTTLTQKKVCIDGDGGKRSDGGVGRGKKKGKREMDPVECQDELLKRYGERRWWKDTHPEGRDRVEYLLKAIYPVRQAFWANERMRRVPIKRFQYRPSRPSLPLLAFLS